MNLLNEYNTACLVIDMQEKLIKSIHNYEELIEQQIKLIKGLNLLNIPILVSEQYPKGLGATITELSAIINPKEVIEKTEFSVYRNANGKKIINQSKRQNFILVGIESHICLLQTAIEMKKHGFGIYVPMETTSSRHKKNRKNALARLAQENGIITNIESCFFEILEDSRHPKFKEIQALIK